MSASIWNPASPIPAYYAHLVGFTPSGSISATDVQAAIAELDTDGGTSLAAFKAALLDTTDVAENSALVDYNPALAYTVGLGKFLNYTFGRSAGEIANGITPSDYKYPRGHILRYGGDPTGIADSTAAVQAWVQFTEGPRIPYPGTYKITGRINLGTNPNIDFGGMILDASSGTTFTSSSVLYTEGALTQIADLSVSPAEAATSLAFGSAHTLAANDVAIIYNPANSSWNAARTMYRAGEYFQVQYVSSSTGVKVWNPLYAGYTAANVDAYKMTSNEVNLANVKIIAPGSGSIRPLRIRLATKVRLAGIQCSGSDYVGIELDRCYNVELRSVDVFEQPQVYSDEYGISIGNCQHVRIFGGQFNASRHSVSIGGDDFTGVVPNRDIKIIGAVLRNDPASNAPAADVHGNCEDIEYVGCTIYGGGTFGGKDVAYRGCKFLGASLGNGALVVGGSEAMGGHYVVEGCYLKATAAYASGVVRGYNGATATVADSHLIVKNCEVDMSTCDVFARFDMANDTFKANAHIENITFKTSSALVNILRMVGTGAAGDGDYVAVDGIVNARAGAILYTATSGYGAAVKARLMRQTGSVTIAMTSGAVVTPGSVTYRLSYGNKTPKVFPSLNSRIIGTHPLGVAVQTKSATGATFDVYTTDNVNAGATPNVVVDYVAEISEI